MARSEIPEHNQSQNTRKIIRHAVASALGAAGLFALGGCASPQPVESLNSPIPLVSTPELKKTPDYLPAPTRISPAVIETPIAAETQAPLVTSIPPLITDTLKTNGGGELIKLSGTGSGQKENDTSLAVIEKTNFIETDKIEINLAGHEAELTIGIDPAAMTEWQEKWGLKGLKLNSNLPKGKEKMSELVNAIIYEDIVPKPTFTDYQAHPEQFHLKVTDSGGKISEIKISDLKSIDVVFLPYGDKRLHTTQSVFISPYPVGWQVSPDGHKLNSYTAIIPNESQLSIITKGYRTPDNIFVLGDSLGTLVVGSLLQLPYGEEFLTGNKVAGRTDWLTHLNEMTALVPDYLTNEKVEADLGTNVIGPNNFPPYARTHSFWEAIK